MDETGNITLQASYLVCANNLRREAKLCDIILYVQGRMGAMVGYPAHKLLLISASKYFKLLFEREDLRNYCHFPHLSEEGVFAVLDIIYGREIRKETNLDDALMAARFLQVDCAVDVLERKKTEKVTQARASPERPSQGDRFTGVKRKSDAQHRDSRPEKQRQPSTSSSGEVRQFKNFASHGGLGGEEEEDSPSNQASAYSEEDSSYSYPGGGGGGGGSSGYQDNTGNDQGFNIDLANVKKEADVDLTTEDSDHDLSQLGFGQQSGQSYDGQSFGGMQMDSEGNAMFSGNAGQSDNVYSPGDMTGMPPGGAMGQHDNSQMQATGGFRSSNETRCKICDKQCMSAWRLTSHMRVHSNDLPFECDICGMKFRYACNRKKHMQRHNDDRPFECEICNRKFKLREDLKSHFNVHTLKGK